ncbi:MAG: hypothetical protein AAF502_21410 [Bacteroidota bacterium]
MSENIILKKSPKIEFRIHDNGFELIDGQTAQNNGFYAYNDLQAVDLNKAWFPRLAKWLRAFTWILNGVPYFPDAETCKKANLIFHFKKSKLGIWLTDTKMADNAKKIKALLDERAKHSQMA